MGVLRDAALTLWVLHYLCGFSVRSELSSEMGSGCWGTGCCWQSPHMFGVGDNTQTHSSLSFVSGMRVRAMGLYYVGQSTENPFSVLCIFRIPGRIMHLIYGLWFVLICCSSVSQSCLTLCEPMDCSHQASFSFTISQSLLKLMSIELVMPSNHLILCYPLLLLPSVLPSIRVFSNESALCIRWPKHWSFSFSISPSNEYSRLIAIVINTTNDSDFSGRRNVCLLCLLLP